MPRPRNERALREEFARDYQLAQTPVMRKIQCTVWGRDYGATSWATRSEAEDIAKLLELEPGKRLLEVGAGAGWPGLYFARTTGCDVALVDVPLEGLRIAAERAAADHLTSRCWVALADGAALPFEDGSFDAISHSDVLCCLEAKHSVLNECRRVVRPGGKMVFSVVSIAPDLSPADYQRAVESGPPFVEAPSGYPDMLEQNGWSVTQCVDLARAFVETTRQLIREDEAHADELSDLLGETQFTERLASHRTVLGVIEEGLLRRELFAATTATPGEPV